MRCANPQCEAEAAYLRSGSLHWIDDPPSAGNPRHGHFVWLCEVCASAFVVETWRPPGEQLRRMPQPSAEVRKPIRSESRDRDFTRPALEKRLRSAG